MKVQACKVTYNGVRYHIASDGTVTTIAFDTENGWRFESGPVDPATAKAVRKDAARQRRNRNARERHAVMTDLGLKRVRGALGGVYYE